MFDGPGSVNDFLADPDSVRIGRVSVKSDIRRYLRGARSRAKGREGYADWKRKRKRGNEWSREGGRPHEVTTAVLISVAVAVEVTSSVLAAMEVSKRSRGARKEPTLKDCRRNQHSAGEGPSAPNHQRGEPRWFARLEHAAKELHQRESTRRGRSSLTSA